MCDGIQRIYFSRCHYGYCLQESSRRRTSGKDRLDPMFSRINKRSSFVWRLPRCALAILAVASMVSIAHAPPVGEVIITDGASPGFCRDVGRRLSDVINVLHTACLDTSDFTATGYEVASSLLAKVQMENAAFTHRTKLLRRPDSLWEVRDVRVRVAMGDTPGTPYQYLVFVLTQKGLIDDMRFSVERWQYRDLNTQGEQLRDWPLTSGNAPTRTARCPPAHAIGSTRSSRAGTPTTPRGWPSRSESSSTGSWRPVETTTF